MSNMSNTTDKSFDTAFKFTMQQEIGGWFNDQDPDVVQGLCATVAQKKKVGWVNNPADTGGLTKFGIAQKSHPAIDVSKLTLAQAKKIYYDEYWVPARCSDLPAPLCIAHFDAAVNHGISRANKFLQQAVGAAVDGVIGPKTISLANQVMPLLTPAAVLKSRRDFFASIVKNRPDQNVFLKGWLARCDRVEQVLK